MRERIVLELTVDQAELADCAEGLAAVLEEVDSGSKDAPPCLLTLLFDLQEALEGLQARPG